MERADFNHGFDPLDWERAKNEARAIMYDVARRSRTIPYSELVNRISSVTLDPHDIRLDHFLGQIAREDDDVGKGLTTVLVVHKTGDMQPGQGFFEMAESQGRVFNDKLEFWAEEIARVYAYWRER